MLDFDATSQVVDCGSDATLDNVWAGGGTMTGWVIRDGAPGGGFGRIADKSSDISPVDGWLISDNVTEQFIFAHSFSGVGGSWSLAAGALPTGTLTHVAVTYDKDSTANDPVMYLDGLSATVTEDATPTGTADTDAAQDFGIGNIVSQINRGWNGRIGDVRMYNRILSAEEIQTIHITRGHDGIVEGLVGRWTMSEYAPGNIPFGDINFRDVAEAQVTTATSLTVSVPTVVDGDLMVAFICPGGNSSTSSGVSPVVTTPSGWTAWTNGEVTAGALSRPSLYLFYRTASSEPGTYNFPYDQSCSATGVIMTYDPAGLTLTPEITGTINNGTSTAPQCPSETTTADSLVIRIIFADDDDNITPDWQMYPPGTIPRVSVTEVGPGGGVGNGCTLIVSDHGVVSGATGTATGALAASEEWGAFTMPFNGATAPTNTSPVVDLSNNGNNGTPQADPNTLLYAEDPFSYRRRTA